MARSNELAIVVRFVNPSYPKPHRGATCEPNQSGPHFAQIHQYRESNSYSFGIQIANPYLISRPCILTEQASPKTRVSVLAGTRAFWELATPIGESLGGFYELGNP